MDSAKYSLSLIQIPYHVNEILGLIFQRQIFLAYSYFPGFRRTLLSVEGLPTRMPLSDLHEFQKQPAIGLGCPRSLLSIP